jgi:hypothetical protein
MTCCERCVYGRGEHTEFCEAAPSLADLLQRRIDEHLAIEAELQAQLDAEKEARKVFERVLAREKAKAVAGGK